MMTTIEPPAAKPAEQTPKYQRTVITTGRRKEEPKAAEFRLAKAEVLALSKARKDAAWYARRRLAAWKIYDATPMPTLGDEAWRRTDIRPFRWGEVVLPHRLNGKAPSKRVP